MRIRFATLLVAIILAAAILPPGYSAYIGAYIALIAALVALLSFARPEQAVFAEPTAVAILVAIGLVAGTVPFTYQSPADLVAPVLILPMLATIGLAALARPTRWIPSGTEFALLCLAATAIALAGGIVENVVLGVQRPGLGNNPIHFSTIAAMTGCLAMVGVAASASPRRYLFMLGPVFGLATAFIADSRGPMVGAAAMTGLGLVVLSVWFWREAGFRWSILGIAVAALAAVMVVASGGGERIASIFDTALRIFQFSGSGGAEDVRAALYASALAALAEAPVFGHGLGQIMLPAQTMFPNQSEVFTLDNLHADWANFSVMAGGMGLLAYILLLAAPLLLLTRASARQDRVIILGALLLPLGQLTLGISNAMFGILPQTTVYAVMLGYLLLRSRRQASYPGEAPVQPD